MAFCRNCGQQVSDGATFCAHCGTPVAAAQPQQPQQPQQPVTGDADVQANRGIAWLSYVGLLFLVPLFARKRSEYCQYHVKQGATLFAADLAYLITTEILKLIIGAIFPARLTWYGYAPSGVYTAFSIIFGLGYIFFSVMAIIGIVNAATGKKNELPLLGKIPFIATLMDKIYAALNK